MSGWDLHDALDFYLEPIMNRPRTLQASALIVFSTLGFGAISVFTLLATRDGAALETVLAARYALATVTLLIITGGGALRVARQRIARLITAGGLGQVLLTWTALSALRYLSAATVSFIFYTYPVWVTLIEAVTRAERVTRVRAAALLLAVAGLAVMIGSPFSGRLSLLGIGLSLASALVYAVYIPLINKLQAGVAPAVASLWVSVGAGVLYLLIALATHRLALPASLTGWSAIVGLALLSTVAAFILFLRGLAVLGPVRTSIISTGEPFFTAVLAALVLGQALTARVFAGGVFIMAAVTLINLSRERPGSRVQTTLSARSRSGRPGC